MTTKQQWLDEVSKLSTERLTQLCLNELGNQGCIRVPSTVQESFYKSLTDAVIMHRPPESVIQEETPAYMLMMLNSFISMVASLIVVTAARNPKQLRKMGVIPDEDQEMLVRRGMEDELLTIAIETLKKHILDSHIDYRQFNPSKED